MEGGLLVTNDTEIDHLARAIRNHGWARDLPADCAADTAARDDPFFEAYRFIMPGYNVRPLEMCGAIGLEQLKKLDGMRQIRGARTPRCSSKLFRGDDRFILQRENGVQLLVQLHHRSSTRRPASIAAASMGAMRGGGHRLPR